MRNIVLYRLIFGTGMLMILSALAGQKPAIDLLPSSHQYMHPAAIIDTSFANDSLSGISPIPRPPAAITDTLAIEKKEKKHFHFGLDLDSILKNGEVRKVRQESGSGLIPQLLKNFNPIKLFIHITALN